MGWGGESILIRGNHWEFKQKHITAVIYSLTIYSLTSMRHGRAADTIDLFYTFYHTFCLNYCIGHICRTISVRFSSYLKNVGEKKNTSGIRGNLIWIFNLMHFEHIIYYSWFQRNPLFLQHFHSTWIVIIDSGLVGLLSSVLPWISHNLKEHSTFLCFLFYSLLV